MMATSTSKSEVSSPKPFTVDPKGCTVAEGASKRADIKIFDPLSRQTMEIQVNLLYDNNRKTIVIVRYTIDNI